MLNEGNNEEGVDYATENKMKQRGLIDTYTYFESVEIAFVFSLDEVFSYNVVERLGIMLTFVEGRLLFGGSYLGVVRGFGLLMARKRWGKAVKNSFARDGIFVADNLFGYLV